jgi:hypothetical protein
VQQTYYTVLNPTNFTISNKQLFVLFLLLSDSPASEFYVPTFRNTLFHLSFGWFAGGWILCADVSEHPVPSFFWVIRRRLNFMCRRFRTPCFIFLLGDSSASEIYVPTFRNSLLHLYFGWFSGIWILCARRFGTPCSIFLLGDSPASEFYVPTFRNTLLHISFGVIPRRLNFMCRRFGTPCYIFIGVYFEDGTGCSETSAHKIQTPGNHPKERWSRVFRPVLTLPGTHFTGGRVGPRAGLDGRKISSPPGFDPGPSSP